MDDPAQSHPVHGALQQLEALSESSQLTDLNEEIDDQRRRSLDRVFYLASETRKRLSKLKGVRANLSVFTNIQNSAQSVRQELENYISNKNPGHIDNALNQADQGLAIYLSQLPAGSVAAEAETALESFRKSSRSAVGELKANEGILKQQVSKLEQTVTEQDERIRQAQSEVEMSKQELANALSTTDVNFATLKTGFETQFGALLEAHKRSLKADLEKSASLIQRHLDELEDKKLEAASIVQSVGDILTTGTYKATAENEAKLANRYRWVTIGLFGLGILIVISNFVIHAVAAWKGVKFEESPWFIISRFATAIAVALPALYTARESARHRTNADRARQRELELTTLGPFIELLPSEKKAEIRDRLTDSYFGAEVEAHEVHPPVDAEQATRFVEALAKLKP
jgi:membrane-associated HD superfamily phosphohydrolase